MTASMYRHSLPHQQRVFLRMLHQRKTALPLRTKVLLTATAVLTAIPTAIPTVTAVRKVIPTAIHLLKAMTVHLRGTAVLR